MMGLASRLTHALVLTDLNRSLSHSARCATYTSVPVRAPFVDDKKVKERKRETQKDPGT